jgi:hypothetical protein
MAICKSCNQEMRTANTCKHLLFVFDGQEYDPIMYLGEGRCHDCGVQPGAYHHPGCDMEKCPKCGGQAIGCDCEQDVEDEIPDTADF